MPLVIEREPGNLATMACLAHLAIGLVIVALSACERTPGETDRATAVVVNAAPVSRVRPPPPPPPPPPPSPQPPPAEVTSFLRASASCTEPWQVMLLELDAKRAGPFLGRRIGRHSTLTTAQAEDLIARLVRDSTYVDGDVGCVGDEFGLRIRRGAAVLDLVVDCSHVYFTEHGHEGRWALFSDVMWTHLTALRDRAF
jgi:hypothetical protein